MNEFAYIVMTLVAVAMMLYHVASASRYKKAFNEAKDLSMQIGKLHEDTLKTLLTAGAAMQGIAKGENPIGVPDHDPDDLEDVRKMARTTCVFIDKHLDELQVEAKKVKDWAERK